MNVAVALTPEFALRVRRDEPLSRHTSWHVGGPAEVFFNPRDVAELAAFLKSVPADVPVTFIGLGSNLLVRDGGLPGVVISTQGTLDALERLSETHVPGGYTPPDKPRRALKGHEFGLKLKLEQRKAQMDILVVDRAEKVPTEN